jgi:hypothetical protein
MAYKKPPEPPKPILPDDKGTATGLDSSKLSAGMIAALIGVPRVATGKDGETTESDAKEMRKKAQQALCDAINDEVLSNCYVIGKWGPANIPGSPPVPDPFQNMDYKFEVLQCNLQGSDFMDFGGGDHTDVMTNYETLLAKKLEETIRFKNKDTREYITLGVASLKIFPETLKINIKKNDPENPSAITQEQMIARIVEAVIKGIEEAKVISTVSPTTSIAGGIGPWVFSEIV